jgi:hypothetical protein
VSGRRSFCGVAEHLESGFEAVEAGCVIEPGQAV